MGGGEIAFYQAENLRGGGNLDGWPSRGISPFANFCVKQEVVYVKASICQGGRSFPFPGIATHPLASGGTNLAWEENKL